MAIVAVVLLLVTGKSSPSEAGDFDITTLIVSDLIVNGDFDTDLSGWTEEENADLNSYWAPIDVDGSSTSGSFAGVELTDGDGFRAAAWQCVTVVPGDVYLLRFAGREERPSEIADTAVIELRNVTGEPCPDGGNPPPNSATEFGIPVSSDAWSSEVFATEISPFVEKVAVTLIPCCADKPFLEGDDDAGSYFDRVVFGRERPDLSTQLTVPDEGYLPDQLIEIVVEVTNVGRNTSLTPRVKVLHYDRLSLVGESCPGNVNDASQGDSHFFHWFNIPPLASGESESCTITARLEPVPAGSYALRSAPASPEGDLDHTNNVSEDDLVVDPATDMGVDAFGVTPYPSAGEPVKVSFRVSNAENLETSSGDVVLSLSEPLTPTDLACSGVAWVQEDTTTFSGDYGSIASGDSHSCDLAFETDPGFTGQIVANLTIFDALDYDTSDNTAQATSQVVRLRANLFADGVDASPGDAECLTGGGFCTFRAAVMEANALPGHQVVEVPGSQFVYQLTFGGFGSSAGDVDVFDAVTIRGETDEAGFRPAVFAAFPDGQEERVLQVSTPGKVVVENMTLGGQDTPISQNGAVIGHFAGELVLRDLFVRDGRAQTLGGGLFSESDVTIDRVRFLDNGANFGSAIGWAPDGSEVLRLERSVVSGNGSGAGQTHGGGLWISGGSCLAACNNAYVVESTLDGNFATRGGAIGVDEHTVWIDNSTISGNSAGAEGGGLWLRDSAAYVRSTTLVHNEAGPGDPSTGLGGGIYVGSGSETTLHNTIVAYNTAQVTGSPPFTEPYAAACWGTLDSLEHNSVQPTFNDDACLFSPTTGDYELAVPDLGPLADNGGPTPTHALLSPGQEIDKGAPHGSGGGCLPADQRGVARPQDGDDDGTSLCDKGAYEAAPSLIFDDGFESGDTSGWDTVVP